MLPTVGFLTAALVCGAGVAALAALVREIRGVPGDPTRPPRIRLASAVRSPAVSVPIAGAVLAGAAVLVATRWPVAAVGVALLIALWPKLFGGKRAEQRRIAQLEALVAFTESLRDTVAAGDTLEQALPAAAKGVTALLRPALARLVGQIRARVPLDEALTSLAAELRDASADLVIGALVLNVRRRGDRLTDVLTGLATSAREELDMRRQVTAGREETRRGVQIVAVVTAALAVFLTIFGRGYVAAYNSVGGQVVLAVVAGIFAAGFFWMRRLSTPPPRPAVLAYPDRRISPAEQRMLTALLSAPATDRGAAR